MTPEGRRLTWSRGGERDRAGEARPRRRLALAVVAVIVLVALAWLVEWRAAGGVSTPGGAASATQAAPPGYVVTVVRAGEPVRSFTPTDLGRLPQRTIMSYGKEQEGPSVLAVLAVAGIERFDRLEIRGMGLRDEGHLALAAARVDEDLLLDFNERGTLKVVSPELEWRERVRDVTELRVDD